MSAHSDDDKRSFAVEMSRRFDFLGSEAGMKRGKVLDWGGDDPRDSVLVIRYARDDLKIDIAWTKFAQIFTINVRFDDLGLTRQERSVNFEHFLEYCSNGAEKPIVPIFGKRVANVRNKAFERGLSPVIEALADKLRIHLSRVEEATSESIRAYHAWVNGKP